MRQIERTPSSTQSRNYKAGVERGDLRRRQVNSTYKSFPELVVVGSEIGTDMGNRNMTRVWDKSSWKGLLRADTILAQDENEVRYDACRSGLTKVGGKVLVAVDQDSGWSQRGW
jgi:hypothetical protein